jgi:hypothetical protein
VIFQSLNNTLKRQNYTSTSVCWNRILKQRLPHLPRRQNKGNHFRLAKFPSVFLISSSQVCGNHGG